MSRTCGDCKHSKIPPPKMSGHKPPRVLRECHGSGVLPARGK